MALPLLLAGGALISPIAKMFMAGRMNQEAKAVKKSMVNPAYTGSKAVDDNLAVAKNLYYGRNPAFVNAAQNITGAAATQLGGVERNAASASDVLAMAGAVGAQTQSGLADLGAREAEAQLQEASLLQSAYGMQAQDDQAVHQDRVRTYEGQREDYNALKAGARGTMLGAAQDIGSGLMYAGMGGFGDLSKIFGKKAAAPTGGGIPGVGLDINQIAYNRARQAKPLWK